MRTVLIILAFVIDIVYGGCKKEENKLSKKFLPQIETVGVPFFTNCSAECFGLIESDMGYTVTERGFCYSTDIDPTIEDQHITCGAGSGNFDAELTMLLASTRYYVRAYAVNQAGTAYGSAVSFVTLEPSPPVVVTHTATDVSVTSAKIRVEITSTGGNPLEEVGVCYSVSESPDVNDSVIVASEFHTNIDLTLTGLTGSTKYYFSGYAKAGNSVFYGDVKNFMTKAVYGEVITDIDGNQYRTVKINNQTWMADNLNTHRLNDGTPIQNITSYEWEQNETIPKYCYALDDADHDTAGALYNYYIVNTNKLCPLGWHVPTTAEWVEMLNYAEWDKNELSLYGNNGFGFSARPYYWRNYDGYDFRDERGRYWVGDDNMLYVIGDGNLTSGPLQDAFSVRCIKDGSSPQNNFFIEEFNQTLGVFSQYSALGDQVWTGQAYDDGCITMTGNVSGINFTNEDWLISPAISLTGKSNVKMMFREAMNYAGNISQEAKVFISTTYTGAGNPNDSEWTELTGFTRSSGNYWTFVNTSDIDLSNYDGQEVRIGFKYTSTTSVAGTWEISRIILTSE